MPARMRHRWMRSSHCCNFPALRGVHCHGQGAPREHRTEAPSSCYDEKSETFGRRSDAMDDITYTKGIYTATASIRDIGQDTWQGVVTLARDEGDESVDQETTLYEVDATSSTPEEALEEAKALAHRILGEIEL
jgi:hypothetical protein